MSDNDSDHFFSALEILSDAAAASSAYRDDRQASIYADDSILICSLPETSCSDPTPSAVIAATVSPLMRQTVDPLSCKNFQPHTVEEAKGGLTEETISSHFSDEEKHEDIAGIERIADENIIPSFAPDTSGGSGDRKDGDNSWETMVPIKEPQLDFVVGFEMMPNKPDQRFEDTDILKIAAMKGIHFPPPKWWRPGGYEAQKHQSTEVFGKLAGVTPNQTRPVSPPMGQTVDSLSCKDFPPQPVENDRGGLMGAEISLHDSDEKKQDDIGDENINPSFAPDISGGSSDHKNGDGLRETMFPMKESRFDLANIIKMLSKKTDQRFEDTDILEIAAMKGIHFAPPKWWRPGGYGAKKHQSLENAKME